MLPTQQNGLKLEWVGPYPVTRRVILVDYEVESDLRKNLVHQDHSSC